MRATIYIHTHIRLNTDNPYWVPTLHASKLTGHVFKNQPVFETRLLLTQNARAHGLYSMHGLFEDFYSKTICCK